MGDAEIRLLLAEKLVLMSQLMIVERGLRQGLETPYLAQHVRDVLGDIHETRVALRRLKERGGDAAITRGMW